MDDDPLDGDRCDDWGRPVDELEPAAVAVLADTRAAFADLAHLLQSHFAKEENVLFPALEEMAKADREGGHRPLN